jgi:Tfp pilus assembly protein PilW
MPLELMIALILVLPIIILFAVFVWYLNIGRIFATVREGRRNRETATEENRPETSRS